MQHAIRHTLYIGSCILLSREQRSRISGMLQHLMPLSDTAPRLNLYGALSIPVVGRRVSARNWNTIVELLGTAAPTTRQPE